MLFFIFTHTLFVAVRTIFNHLFLSIALYIILLTSIFFYVPIFGIDRHRQIVKIVVISLSFSLTTGLYRYTSIQAHDRQTALTSLVQPTPNFSSPTIFITGHIIDIRSPDTFTVQTHHPHSRPWRFIVNTSFTQPPHGGYSLPTGGPPELGTTIFVYGKITYPHVEPIDTSFHFPSLHTIYTELPHQFDYPKRLRMQRVDGAIQARSVEPLSSSPVDLPPLLTIKKELLTYITTHWGADRTTGLFQGMILGERGLLPDEDYQAFIESGLVHLIAVSGSNIMYVLVFFQTLFFFIPFYVRIVLAIFLVVGYGVLCGLDSSVVRACCMGILGLLAILRGTTLLPWRSVGIVRSIMLLWNPYFLFYDLGFLLSFSALSGILLFTQRFSSHTGIISKLYTSYLLPTLAATRGVTPILLLFVGTVNITSIVGNILIAPLVPFLLLRGVLTVVLGTIGDISPWIDIMKIPFELIFVISRRLIDHGLYLSLPVGFTKFFLLLFIGAIPFIIHLLHKIRTSRSGQHFPS